MVPLRSCAKSPGYSSLRGGRMAGTHVCTIYMKISMDSSNSGLLVSILNSNLEFSIFDQQWLDRNNTKRNLMSKGYSISKFRYKKHFIPTKKYSINFEQLKSMANPVAKAK